MVHLLRVNPLIVKAAIALLKSRDDTALAQCLADDVLLGGSTRAELESCVIKELEHAQSQTVYTQRETLTPPGPDGQEMAVRDSERGFYYDRRGRDISN